MRRVKRDHTFDVFVAECMGILSEACHLSAGFDLSQPAIQDVADPSAPALQDPVLLKEELT
jgi:hypothetical protein